MTRLDTKDIIGNRWLAALSQQDFDLIGPHLSEIAFDKGVILFDAGEKVDQVYFPTEGVVSLMTLLKGGQMVETAAIGSDGLVGVTCGPLNGRAVSRAVTQTSGYAASVPAKSFEEALGVSPGIRAALARYTEALFAQVQQTAACNALHTLEARFARWLLVLHDRDETAPGFELTQQQLSEMLGVRRASVSEAGSALEKRGLIRRARGRIEIADRKGLEAAACECYAAIRRTTQALLG